MKRGNRKAEPRRRLKASEEMRKKLKSEIWKLERVEKRKVKEGRIADYGFRRGLVGEVIKALNED